MSVLTQQTTALMVSYLFSVVASFRFIYKKTKGDKWIFHRPFDISTPTYMHTLY